MDLSKLPPALDKTCSFAKSFQHTLALPGTLPSGHRIEAHDRSLWSIFELAKGRNKASPTFKRGFNSVFVALNFFLLWRSSVRGPHYHLDRCWSEFKDEALPTLSKAGQL
jgi:hypothetical protein